MIKLVSSENIKLMKHAGVIWGKAMESVAKSIKPGVTTKQLNDICEKVIRENDAVPSFLNYGGFPASICASVNDEVVHGLPSNRKLKNGDIISIDIGVVYKGFHADAARTFGVGQIKKEDKLLIERTRQSFFEAISKIKAGSNLNEIGKTIQNYVESFGYGVVREMVGHGIGANLHEAPEVLNYDGYKGTGGKLLEGQTIAIEPMINAGSPAVKFSAHDIPIVTTADGKNSAHYENTVMITKDGVEIFTVFDETKI
jgi:methionyl aminopeptidase